MTGPVSYDIEMSEIAAHCLEVVAGYYGLTSADLHPVEFQIVRFDDGRHAGRVTLAAAPLPPAHFEPGAPR